MSEPQPLLRELNRLRSYLLDPAVLVKAVASGRRKGEQPTWRRAELRYVDLKAGRHLQITTYDQTQAFTENHAVGDAARDAVDALLDEPYGEWHVDTVTQSHQLRVTSKLAATVRTTDRSAPVEATRGHDKAKQRLLPEDDPVFIVLGISDDEGRIKPSRQAKYRQVEEFLRLLDSSITEAIDKGHLRRPTVEEPLRIVDLGCGNAYLTFAAERFLTGVRKLPVRLTGVDVKEQSREHNSSVARELGVEADFVVGTIGGVELDPAPEVVLALHACDTATDEALAQ
ncbi:class I SAM-dependent methyltransferase, partial [Nocardioides hankookensis]